MTTELQNFYDQAPIGICAVRRDRRKPMAVLYANPVFSGMLGLDGTLVGHPLDEAWPSRIVLKLLKALKSTTPPHVYSLPVGDEGALNRRWITLTIAEAVFGGEECFIFWATDISQSKEAETQLREAVQQADALAEMKANFLATMSHEIRTPMQAIYGLIELIGEEKPDEKILQMVNIAKNSASGLLEILDDVLDFAKIDAGKMEFDMFEVPVRTLAGGILEAMAVKARGKDVRLVGDIDENVPFVIIGDPKRLRQIMINLMSNALKFTMKGSVILRVTPKCRVLKGTHGINLRFEIVDTGIGIKPDVAANLFQPFTQADNSTSRRFGGTGLGLSICKKLVEHMGGAIGVVSAEGKGSTFWFEIPTEEIGTEDSTAQLPSLEGISILSVEDHPQGAREIKRSLESMGATVESCPTFAEGLALVKRRPFDVGVIDQGLPDGLGIDLVRQIMDLRPFMGLIMYTARDDIGLQHSLNSLGVQYLPKPAGRLSLGENVKDAARKYRHLDHDGPTRLLIAEDTPSVRDVLQRQLDKLDVEADFAENGADALEALSTGKYGILFTDLHMPLMDGYTLVSTLRAREEKDSLPHLPIMVLTADVQMSQRHTYLSHGFDECLLKPVSLGQLRRLLIRWGLLQDHKTGTPDKHDEPSPAPVATPSKSPIDKDAIRRQMGALDKDSVEMLRMFADMTAPLIERLTQAHKDNDVKTVEETAHSLKGAARSACCPHMGDIAASIQDDASKGKDCSSTITALIAEFGRVKDAIATLQPDS